MERPLEGYRKWVVVVLGVALLVGVALPAGLWLWGAVAERWERSSYARMHEMNGDEAMAQGDYALALNAYNYARDSRPGPEIAMKFIRARLMLASIRPDLLARWDRDEVEYQMKAMAQKDAGAAALVETLHGHIRRSMGDAQGARDRYKAALAADPDLAGAHLGLGLLAFAEGKNDEAKSELELFVKKFPEHRDAVLSLANIRLDAGDADGAMELLNRLLALGPDSDVHHLLGLAFRAKNQLRDAVVHLQTAVRLNPSARASHMALGNIYLDAQLFALAEASFRNALSIAQDDGALIGLAQALNGQQRYEEALSTIAPVLQRGNATPNALLAGAEAQAGLGRKEEALRLYNELRQFISRLEGRVNPGLLEPLKQRVNDGLAKLGDTVSGQATPRP